MRILSYFYVIEFFCCGISGSDIIDLYEKLKNNYDIDIPGIDFWNNQRSNDFSWLDFRLPQKIKKSQKQKNLQIQRRWHQLI